jgi:RNA polymerase sigma factor (sigma-70 family)
LSLTGVAMLKAALHLDRGLIHDLIGKHNAAAVTDRELLRRFAERHDEAAFDTLFRRHAAMVLAAGRRALGNTHDAEDVCQAAFLVLARKAASQHWQPSIAHWLHKTAYQLALKVRTAAARRACREGKHAPRPPVNPLAEITGQELLAALDEELLALPERLRAPLVLCYLQGATRDEAARQLGCPLSTLRKRLERGRERLHDALVRRGSALSALLVDTLGTRPGADAAVANLLARKTARAAVSLATGRTIDDVIAPQVSQLIQGQFTTMFSKTVRILFGLLAASLCTAAALAYSARDDKQASSTPQASAPVPGEAEPAVTARKMRVVVRDPQGKPLAEAKIHASVWTYEKGFKANRDYRTDTDGAAVVELPATLYILRLWAGKKPFVKMFANWENNDTAGGAGLPAEYVFRLEPAVRASGRIVDEQGQPIRGVKVQVSANNNLKPVGGDGRVQYDTWLANGFEAARTDSDGRWHIDNVPGHPNVDLSLMITHPDYVSDQEWGQIEKASRITTGMLLHGTASLTLKRGVAVKGRVTDPAGQAIADAIVVLGDDPYMAALPTKFTTDSEGRFQLPVQAPGETTLTVIARGLAPQLRKLKLEPGLPSQDFYMQAGKAVRLRVLDASGKPVSGAYVSLLEWNGSKSIQSSHNPNHPKVPDNKIPRAADANGAWEWTSAPDGPVKVRIGRKGFTGCEVDVIAGTPERVVTLKSEHRITGRVTDAVTGKDIPSFNVIAIIVFRRNFLVADRGNALPGKNGGLDFLAERTDCPLRLRIEAMGYRTQDGPEFRVGDDTSRTQNFRLQPSPPVTGIVLDADGRRVNKAEVVLATPTQDARLGARSDNSSNLRVFTDSAGRFSFPDPGEPFAVVTRADSGFAQAEFPADAHDIGTLRLQHWSSVRGQFRDGGNPVAGATVLISSLRAGGLHRPRLYDTLLVATGPDGRFEASQVPPGPSCVHVFLGPWKDEGFRSGPSVPLNLRPGECAALEPGSGGAILSGKVKLAGKVPADLNCSYSLNYLVRREPGIVPPPDIAAAGFDARKGWRDVWEQTPEGLAFFSTLQHWFVKLAADGSFRISGVPAGEYDLAVAVYAKPKGCLVDPLARLVARVTVTAADAARGVLAVPEICATVEPVPAVGDVPALTYRRGDGTPGSLVDCRGKFTVVHFWASWCLPCRKELPEVRRLQERFASRGLATLSLSVDDDGGAWQVALRELNLPWQQGRIGAQNAAGISSVPCFWLLDPDGKIAATANDPDELVKDLDKWLKRAPG